MRCVALRPERQKSCHSPLFPGPMSLGSATLQPCNPSWKPRQTIVSALVWGWAGLLGWQTAALGDCPFTRCTQHRKSRESHKASLLHLCTPSTPYIVPHHHPPSTPVSLSLSCPPHHPLCLSVCLCPPPLPLPARTRSAALTKPMHRVAAQPGPSSNSPLGTRSRAFFPAAG